MWVCRTCGKRTILQLAENLPRMRLAGTAILTGAFVLVPLMSNVGLAVPGALVATAYWAAWRWIERRRAERLEHAPCARCGQRGLWERPVPKRRRRALQQT